MDITHILIELVIVIICVAILMFIENTIYRYMTGSVSFLERHPKLTMWIFIIGDYFIARFFLIYGHTDIFKTVAYLFSSAAALWAVYYSYDGILDENRPNIVINGINTGRDIFNPDTWFCSFAVLNTIGSIYCSAMALHGNSLELGFLYL